MPENLNVCGYLGRISGGSFIAFPHRFSLPSKSLPSTRSLASQRKERASETKRARHISKRRSPGGFLYCHTRRHSEDTARNTAESTEFSKILSIFHTISMPLTVKKLADWEEASKLYKRCIVLFEALDIVWSIEREWGTENRLRLSISHAISLSLKHLVLHTL